jgi:S1-C subfamily serine protease
VRVLGTACGLGVEGSGWVAAPGVVVTNAHVVAGESDTTVSSDGGPQLGATPIAFDPKNDLAILRVDGLGAHPLTLDGLPAAGTEGAIVGYPENGPLDVEPARVGQTMTVTSQDAYGNGPIRRDMTSVRGLVRPGNSGGPVVGTDGHVLTTIFAETVGGHTASGLGVPNDVVADALANVGTARVSTGPCTA